MKIRLLLLFVIISVAPIGAQIRLDGFNGASVNPALRQGRWSARWISVPGASAGDFGTPQEMDTVRRIYPETRNISIDFGVIEKAEDYIARNKVRASTARLAKSREKMLELMMVVSPEVLRSGN